MPPQVVSGHERRGYNSVPVIRCQSSEYTNFGRTVRRSKESVNWCIQMTGTELGAPNSRLAKRCLGLVEKIPPASK